MIITVTKVCQTEQAQLTFFLMNTEHAEKYAN